MSTDVRWLSAEEERLWRRWMKLNAELTASVQRELQDDAGMSSSDFAVLVNLTDNADGRVRVTDLAGQLLWERSRLSHHVTRMEKRGLVERRDCPEDGRGANVSITARGREAIEKAAPGHVEAVRRLVFDPLSRDEVRTLSALVDKLLDRLEDTPSAVGSADYSSRS